MPRWRLPARSALGVLAKIGADRVVELTHAGEPGRECNVGHRELGRLDQQPGRLGPLGARQGERPGPQLGHEDPLELAVAVVEPRRQPAHAVAVDDAVGDEPHGPRHHVGALVPLGRPGAGVGAAAHAGAEPRRLRGRRGRVEAHVGPLRGHGGAARPAVDAGRRDGGEEPAVEASVLGRRRPVTEVEVLHGRHVRTRRPTCLADFGHHRPSGGSTGVLTTGPNLRGLSSARRRSDGSPHDHAYPALPRLDRGQTQIFLGSLARPLLLGLVVLRRPHESSVQLLGHDLFELAVRVDGFV